MAYGIKIVDWSNHFLKASRHSDMSIDLNGNEVKKLLPHKKLKRLALHLSSNSYLFHKKMNSESFLDFLEARRRFIFWMEIFWQRLLKKKRLNVRQITFSVVGNFVQINKSHWCFHDDFISYWYIIGSFYIK